MEIWKEIAPDYQVSNLGRVKSFKSKSPRILKPQVNHKNGDKTDNRVENLEWATELENQRHAARTGLRPSGENHFKARFTNEQALYVRENPDNLTVKQLAEKFAVDRTTIAYIQTGKNFRHLGGQIRDKKVRCQPCARLANRSRESVIL